MTYRSEDILRLLREVAQKTNKSLVHSNFLSIQEIMKAECGQLPFVSEDYLYRKVFLRVKNADKSKNARVSLNALNVDSIARFLGYKDYGQFIKMQHPEKNPVLENCIGAWYSYVRCNSGSRDVLVSPVHIYNQGKEVRMELQGPVRTFNGKLIAHANCISCFLEGEHEKNLHLVFKIGPAVRPDVLQGVFSGISAAGDPIAGREVLVRQSQKIELLKNRKVRIDVLLASASEEEKKIGAYFSERKENILKAKPSSTFGLADLGGDKS